MKKKIRHKNAAVYFFNKELKSILVHQRAKEEKKFPYTILTPGGKKEKDKDKHISDTAIREIKEETGIDIQHEELIEIGSTNTTKYYLVYFDPEIHLIGDSGENDEILPWTFADIGVEAGDGKHRWLSWSDLSNCKQGPRMHPTDPNDNLGYLHPALLNKFQGGVWNLRRQGIFDRKKDVNMFITKDLKKEIDYLSHKRDICKQQVINFNNKIKPLKRKFQSLKLFNECKIVSKDLLHIRNFNFIPVWSYYDINGKMVPDYSEIMKIQNLYSNFFLKTVGKIIISYKHDYNSYYLSLILKNKPNIHNRFSDDLIRLVNSFMEPEEIMFYVHYSRTNSYENRYYPHESWGSGIKCENSFFGCEFDLDDSADEIIWEGQEHYEGRNSCTYLINKILNGIDGEYEKIMQF